MSQDLFTFEIEPEILPDCREYVLEAAGYTHSDGSESIREILSTLHNESRRVMNIRCGFYALPSSSVKNSGQSIHFLNVILSCNKIIAERLDGSSYYIFFAVTLGSEFDNWSRMFFSNGDPLAGYLADLIGSATVEQAADWLEQKLQAMPQFNGFKSTNRFSPGYCGWDVSEQHKLFTFFPDYFLGITLTESALMTPIKSISGLIGLGMNVKKEAQTCKICEMKNCFMRNTRKLNIS